MHQKFEVKKLGIILKPTKNDFEIKSVLNPGCYQDGDVVHMFYRAIDKDDKSSIGYAKFHGPDKLVERLDKPIIKREHKHENLGVEDPRITKIDDIFYMTYVIHDGKNAMTEYAISKDLKKFKKMDIISPNMTYGKAADYFREVKLKDRYFMFEAYYKEFAGKDVLLWSKDMILFPRKINGKFAMIQRILPDIQIVYFDKFDDLRNEKFWKNYLMNLNKKVILENKYWFESRNIGGGAPPIETEKGWLLIYHSVEELNKRRIYHASAALLDLNDPTKLLGRFDYPLFGPEEPWEKTGFVDNVVFPTGTAIFGEDLYIYYGAADKVIALAKVNLKDLVRELDKTYLHTIKL